MIAVWLLLASNLFGGRVSLPAAMVCEWIVGVDRAHWSKMESFTEELEVFRGLGERRLRSAVEYVPERTRWECGSISTEFKRDNHTLFEIETEYRPRPRYNSICLEHGKRLELNRVLTCVCIRRKTQGGAHRSVWNTVRLVDCRC